MADRTRGQAAAPGRGTAASIAHSVGYGSDSALSTAFKRVMGTSPRDYRGHPSPEAAGFS
ncbi:helix-turn-helix domain-containing protein [Streptomyces yanii]|uniref:Helix-turn-helix domain-containing protein n=1 Tax=Streptomyces yanii TaxID=78510 RepID=A0ABV5R5J0_9ACTN